MLQLCSTYAGDYGSLAAASARDRLLDIGMVAEKVLVVFLFERGSQCVALAVLDLAM